MRTRLFLMTLPLLTACGADAPGVPGDVDVETAVYVGTATANPAGPDAGRNLLVAFVVGCDGLEFFMCGDEAQSTTAAYGRATELTVSGESGSFELGYDPADGQFDGSVASGSVQLRNEPERTFTWQAEAVTSDQPTGPGLYSDGGACATRFIVGPSEMAWSGPTFEGQPVLGSGCTTASTANPLEQVTPILEMDTGYLLRIPSIPRDVDVTRVTACNEP